MYKTYTSRPPAKCRSARKAWDFFNREGSDIKSMRYTRWWDDSRYWMIEKTSGEIDEIEATELISS